MAEEEMCTAIAALRARQKGVNVQFIVLETGAAKRTAEGREVRTVRVADHSGYVDMDVWDEVGAALRPSFICRLRNGFVSVRHGGLSLSVGEHGELTKIGEITMLYSDTPNMSESKNCPAPGPWRLKKRKSGTDSPQEKGWTSCSTQCLFPNPPTTARPKPNNLFHQAKPNNTSTFQEARREAEAAAAAGSSQAPLPLCSPSLIVPPSPSPSPSPDPICALRWIVEERNR